MEEKKCIKCTVLLTDNNKVKNENICKDCLKIRQNEWRERKKNNIPAPEKVLNTHCSKCEVEFNDHNRIKGRTYCKDCRSNDYKSQKESMIIKNNSAEQKILCGKCSIVLTPEIQVAGRKCCKPCDNKRRNESKKSNKDTVHQLQKVYYENNKEKIKEYYKDHYTKNKDKYMENNKKWRDENRDKINEQMREKMRNNENLRLRKNLRKKLHYCLTKDRPTMEYIGCDLEFLKSWLEYNFTEGMTFENYGLYWHVDHVIPCAKFNFENKSEIKSCFSWYNLQPLEASKNFSKHDKINEQEIQTHYNKVNTFITENKLDIKLSELNYKNYLKVITI
jgi:hypothetical protein